MKGFCCHGKLNYTPNFAFCQLNCFLGRTNPIKFHRNFFLCLLGKVMQGRLLSELGSVGEHQVSQYPQLF